MKHRVSPGYLIRGFTLVELVITLVLIGILSALGIGLIASPGAYSAGAARDQFVSSALLAQKRALANTANSGTTLTIEQTDSQWLFRVEHNGTSYPERSADRESADLRINGSLFGNGSLDFEFDSQGHLASGDNVRLEFDGTSVHEACISSLGFAYPQECQP